MCICTCVVVAFCVALCVVYRFMYLVFFFFFFQAEDGIRDLVRSRGLGDVYKRQAQENTSAAGQMGRELSLLMMEKKRRKLVGK